MLVLAMLLAPALAFAEITIPKDSGVLGVTRGKEIKTGLVFIEGKYIPPPYKVERWGVGIRINGTPAIAQAVSWKKLLATQEKKTEAPPAAIAEVKAEATNDTVKAKVVVDDNENLEESLDEIFDDDDEGEKKKDKTAPNELAEKKPVAKPTVAEKPAVEAKAKPIREKLDFKPNESSKAAVKKANAIRADIDKKLRLGGFYCFGKRYRFVSGDSSTAWIILDTLPALQRKHDEKSAFVSAFLNSNISFLGDLIAEDMFKCRVDYIKLQKRRDKAADDRKWKSLLNQ